MRDKLRAALPAGVSLGVFLAALVVLRRELEGEDWGAISGDVVATSWPRLAAALLLTGLNYLVLTGYDLLAFEYLGRPLPRGRRRIAGVSFLAYAIANSVGFAMLSGTSVRYRFYARWGVGAEGLSRIVFSYSVTFWLGLLLLGGLSLALAPPPGAAVVLSPAFLAPLGWALVLASLLWIGVAFWRRKPLHLGRLELPVPAPWLACAQLAVSCLDWALAGAVLYALLPGSAVPFLGLLGAFLIAQILGLASHVPGGVGVFEGLMVLLLKPRLGSGQLLPALVVYRVVYYLLPFVMALVALLVDEVGQRREHARRLGAFFGRASDAITPRALAVLTFLAGVGLLFSGATPAAPGRLAFLDRFLPLGVIEVSHFVGSLLGAGLLIVAQGVARRLDAAYFLASGGVAFGILASLLKGADYEEATLLALLLLALVRARPAFDRKAALFETRFSAGWIAAVGAALLASVWLGFFAHKHVEYSRDLFWQFELRSEISRFLRASVGAAVALLLVGLRRLLGPAAHEGAAPSDAELDEAGRAIAAHGHTSAFLVYLRDKSLLFDTSRRGFVMYGVHGRTWVAMGDPVAPDEAFPDLIRAFLERCDDFAGTPVFYEVRKEQLHHYADFGLAFVKLGEEAIVDLELFDLEGPAAAKRRQALRRLEKEGARFRILGGDEVKVALPELRSVSDDWLLDKAGGEKGFSLGFFEEAYLKRFPVAVIERSGAIVAFANLWLGPGRRELSVDLMRYGAAAPNGVMDAMFVHLMLWGREQGYRDFVLGMAPLSGFEGSPIAPLWARLGHLFYRRGERFYNFQGLRTFKDKFGPRWEPRYLAYPGGLRLPLVLADIAALVSGGYRRIFRR